MSLRGFHVLFIFLAILCSGGFWLWSYLEPKMAQELQVVAVANFSGSLAIGLVVYFFWFVLVKRKTIIIS